jgi:hypothetical protein
VGARLPGLFHDAGLVSIRAWQSESCLTMIPPYDTPGQRAEIRQTLAWIDGGVWLGTGGTREQTRAWYLGGGGDGAGFEDLWALAMREAQAWKAGVLAGAVGGAVGLCFYLVSGRKRAQDA